MRSMDRRGFLRGLAAGGLGLSAGCGRLGSESGVPPDDAVARVSVANVRRFAPGLSLSASVEAVRPWVTPNRTALVEITVHNDGVTPTEVVAGGGNAPVFSARASVGSSPRVALPTARDEESPPRATDRSGEADSVCWRLSEPVVFPEQVLYVSRIPPRDGASVTLEVWGHHRNETCLPTGAFRFEDRYEVRTGTDPVSFDWGFGIRVSTVRSRTPGDETFVTRVTPHRAGRRHEPT